VEKEKTITKLNGHSDTIHFSGEMKVARAASLTEKQGFQVTGYNISHFRSPTHPCRVPLISPRVRRDSMYFHQIQ
jgi:hypothetical protein